MRHLAELVHRIHGAQHVGDVGHSHHFRAGTDHGCGMFHIEMALPIHPDVLYPGTSTPGDLLPRHQVSDVPFALRL
jgi:hypothetical protein